MSTRGFRSPGAGKPGSFMNERTAEYVLVSDLIGRLRNTFWHLTPLFFWASREGGRRARESYTGEVRILGAFARRPKVIVPGAPEIEVKFNEVLFRYARALNEAGIPVVAGAPCISRLSDLAVDVPCTWFQIHALPFFENDAHARVPLTNPSDAWITPSDAAVSGPLSSSDIVALLQHAKLHSWPEGLAVMHSVRREAAAPDTDWWPWFGPNAQYRPFYLVAKE